MILKTKNFGDIEINEKEIITFDDPILGFETDKRYVFMIDDSLNGEFIWLQSVDNGDLCFVLANPDVFIEDYKPVFSEDIESVIGKGTYEIWLIMVVTDDFSESTVNLKSPIIVNLEERRAAQIVGENNYPVRYRLFKENEEVDTVC